MCVGWCAHAGNNDIAAQRAPSIWKLNFTAKLATGCHCRQRAIEPASVWGSLAVARLTGLQVIWNFYNYGKWYKVSVLCCGSEINNFQHCGDSAASCGGGDCCWRTAALLRKQFNSFAIYVHNSALIQTEFLQCPQMPLRLPSFLFSSLVGFRLLMKTIKDKLCVCSCSCVSSSCFLQWQHLKWPSDTLSAVSRCHFNYIPWSHQAQLMLVGKGG